MNTPLLHSRFQGFTVLELLIAVAIAAILAVITVPFYHQYITQSRRSDAVIPLIDLAIRLEQYYSEQDTYATATLATGAATDVLASTDSPLGYYTLSILASPSTTATTFTIKATRDPTGPQANDSACGDFTYTNEGVRGVTGATPVADCWSTN